MFSALGDTDELNANVGLALEQCRALPVPASDVLWHATLDRLIAIQSRLLDVGTAVATPAPSSTPDQLRRAEFPEAAVADLESWIDEMEETLPVLRNFILPVGCWLALHVSACDARPCVCACPCVFAVGRAGVGPAARRAHRVPPGGAQCGVRGVRCRAGRRV